MYIYIYICVYIYIYIYIYICVVQRVKLNVVNVEPVGLKRWTCERHGTVVIFCTAGMG